jgi:acyl-CoA reductase-like NAD-dependent aldehyde dehydrogenase
MRFLNLIDGEAVAPSTGEWIETIDPSTGTPWAEVPRSGAEDIDAAVAAAARAFESGPWTDVPDMGRSRLLRRLAELMQDNSDAMIETEIRDNGRFVQGIKAGAVWVNAYRRNHWALPFGGYKESGYGRDSGVDALAEYQQSKSVWIEKR